MTRADLSSTPGTRIGVAVLVVLIHVAAVLALIRAFAPEFPAKVAEQVISAFTVTVPAPPSPAPRPRPRPKAPEHAGVAARAGKKARPKEVAAPVPKIHMAQIEAPKVAAMGDDVTSGARDRGEDTGAGGQGSGTGAGTSGTGQGGGGGTKAVKIAGDIRSARYYPRDSRSLRIGDYVILTLTVGTDGRVKDCRIYRPSRDPEADRITCKLATERFRFRPATDANGNPVESIYHWKQSWFYPKRKN